MVLTPSKNLKSLLLSMKPMLEEGEFVFCTMSADERQQLKCVPICEFQEAEGVSLILCREDADAAGLKYSYLSRKITLTVYSDLDAVGFLAVICTKLAERGISVNPVSAYYHDHLFVPAEKVALAMDALREIEREASAQYLIVA